ncbi:MAG: TolC family protein, partial [Deltaproteobacteria bacterium]|nr:TolC family protein [Deltaproteobacteria bacterium]
LAQEEGARYPTLDGFASYQYDQGYVIDGSGDSWTAGLRVNYHLYDGSLTRANIARKRVEYGELKEQVTKLELAVNLEIQEAELNLRQAIERSTVTEKMVQVAQESALLSRERFKEGLILSSNLIDTEVRLTDALVRQSAAQGNYRVAIANLRRAVGLQQFMITTEELLENQP